MNIRLDYDSVPLLADIGISEYMGWPEDALRRRVELLFSVSMKCDCGFQSKITGIRRPCNHHATLRTAITWKWQDRIGAIRPEIPDGFGDDLDLPGVLYHQRRRRHE